MKFITFEGGEGSGKTTQSKLLEQALLNEKQQVVLTREPGGTKNAELIRNLLLSEDLVDLCPMTELLLINAARYEHVEKLILPALKDGKFIICDRFVDSTMAYQGFGHKLGKKIPALIHNLTMPNAAPELTFILDLDPKEGLSRSKKAKNDNRFEKMDISFHNKVRIAFQDLANLAIDRCVLLDATRSVSDLHKDIISHVNFRYGINLKPIKDL